MLLKLVASHPDHIEAWQKLAQLATQNKRPAMAIERYQKVLGLSPDDSEAITWLGILYSFQGRFGEAIPLLERAAQSQPDNLQVLVPLAQAYFRHGQYQLAISIFDRALKIKPGDADLLYSRAACLSEALRFSEAESDLNEALARRPIAVGYLQLGNIQQKFSRLAEAIENAEKCLQLDSKNVQAMALLAAAQLSLGLDQDSQATWRKAIDLAAKKEDVLIQKSQAFIDLGRFDEARDVLLELLELQPRRGETYYSLVSSRRISLSDSALLDRIQTLVGDPSLSNHDRLFALYALGKAHNDLGNYETALTKFDEANALQVRMRGGKGFDREQFKRFFDSQIQLYDKAFFASMKPFGNSSELPIFILGMMRSGTSLMEQILSCHPNIGGAGEQPFWHYHEAKLRSFTPGGPDHAQIGLLATEYLNILKSASPYTTKVIDKNPANAMLAGLLHVAFPNAKIINMVRKQVDTALSIWMTPMRTTASFVGDRSDIVYAYQQYERLTAHWRTVIPSDRYLTVRYEDLTHQPEETIRQVLSFSDEEWNPACLHPEHNRRPVLTPSFWQVRQPLYKDSTERWRNYEPWLGEFKALL